MNEAGRKRVGVLLSGRGSNMQALAGAARDPAYPASIALVLSNRADAAGVQWAAERGLPTAVIDHKAFDTRQAFETALNEALDAHGVEIVALAGFMRLLTADFVNRRRGAMINVHPSLLPAFKGLNTHARALAVGAKIVGCSVHFVTPEMDDGPIIAQAAVPVLPGDTADALAGRVLTAEHTIYPQALAWVASGLATFDGVGTETYGVLDPGDRLLVPGLGGM